MFYSYLDLYEFIRNFNDIAILFLILVFFFTFVKFHYLGLILKYIEENYSTFYREINPNLREYKYFIYSGGASFFGIRFFFSSKYVLDDRIKSMRRIYQSVIFFRLVLFIALIMIIFQIKLIVL